MDSWIDALAHDPLATGLFLVAACALIAVGITTCWGWLDGWEARRDSRKRNQATRR